jgi:predicted RNase H-like HicB family nuclease
MMKKDIRYYTNLPYTVVLEHREDQGDYWVARYAEMPYCMMHGDTQEEAIKELQEELPAYIELCLKDNLPMPKPASRVIAGIKVEKCCWLIVN